MVTAHRDRPAEHRRPAPMPDAPPVTSAILSLHRVHMFGRPTRYFRLRPSAASSDLSGSIDERRVVRREHLTVTDRSSDRSEHDQVVVRIGAAGVCHSDISMINGTVGSMIPPPFILGHEGAGVVEAIGSQVTTVKVGDHVVITTIDNCGRCAVCVTGHPTLCQNSQLAQVMAAGRTFESTDELRRVACVLPSRRQADLGMANTGVFAEARRRQRGPGHRHRQERAGSPLPV
jgi:hypothetical protein